MMSFLEPSPTVLALLFMKTTGYLPILMLIALPRAVVARGRSRQMGIAAILLGALGLATHFGPAAFGLYQGATVQLAYGYKTTFSGFGPLIAASLALGASGLAPGRRWWALDVLHGALVLAMTTLWLLTL